MKKVASHLDGAAHLEPSTSTTVNFSLQVFLPWFHNYKNWFHIQHWTKWSYFTNIITWFIDTAIFISNILRSFLVSYNLFLIWCVCLPWPVTWQQLGIFVRLIWLFFYLIYYMYGLQVDWMHGKNNLSQFCYLHFEACFISVVHIVVLYFILASICQYVLSIFLSISDDTCSWNISLYMIVPHVFVEV